MTEATFKLKKRYLPFIDAWRYPQTAQMYIPSLNKLFTLKYSWNRYGYAVINVYDNDGDELIHTGKLTKNMTGVVRNPVTHEPYFIYLPETISPTTCKTLVYWKEMIINAIA